MKKSDEEVNDKEICKEVNNKEICKEGKMFNYDDYIIYLKKRKEDNDKYMKQCRMSGVGSAGLYGAGLYCGDDKEFEEGFMDEMNSWIEESMFDLY